MRDLVVGASQATAGHGRRLDRRGAARIVRRVTRRPGIAKHTPRHAFITAALDAWVPLRDAQEVLPREQPESCSVRHCERHYVAPLTWC